jgi:hypothetical protein
LFQLHLSYALFVALLFLTLFLTETADISPSVCFYLERRELGFWPADFAVLVIELFCWRDSNKRRLCTGSTGSSRFQVVS